MKHDEFAFANQQLAGMLKSGIPLEGALRQLCDTMKRSPLREELSALHADLAQGLPLKDALPRRHLPELYGHMLRVGAESNDLAGVLNLLADYYQRLHTLTTRLKALLVYPFIVLLMALGLSVALTLIIQAVFTEFAGEGLQTGAFFNNVLLVWFTPALLATVTAAAVLALTVPRWRAGWQAVAPGFREARLSQIASALSLLLQKGGSLNQALGLMAQLEEDSKAGRELSAWQRRLAEGLGKIAEFGAGGRYFPPLFIWLVASAGEDLAAGFKQAAELYHARSVHRVEMMLYAFLPIAVLVLGLMVIGQVYPLAGMLGQFVNMLGDFSE